MEVTDTAQPNSKRPTVEALKALTPTQSWVGDVARFQRERMLKQLPDRPTVPDAAARAELIGLLYEESREAQKAMVEGHLPKTIDACVDLIYIAIGVALHHGVDLSPYFEEVHMANMEKQPASGKGFGRMTAEGTSTKANWQEPRIAELLRA